MDKSICQKIVNENIKQLRWLLQLGFWKVDICYEPIAGQTPANCEADPRYESVRIFIDCEKQDKERLFDDLRHELLHCFAADYETYRQAVKELITKEQFAAVDTVFGMAQEKTVGRIENMLDWGLKMPTKKMLRWYEKSHRPQGKRRMNPNGKGKRKNQKR